MVNLKSITNKQIEVLAIIVAITLPIVIMIVTAPKVELKVDDISLSQYVVIPASNISLQFTITNKGNKISDDVKFYYYVSNRTSTCGNNTYFLNDSSPICFFEIVESNEKDLCNVKVPSINPNVESYRQTIRYPLNKERDNFFYSLNSSKPCEITETLNVCAYEPTNKNCNFQNLTITFP